MWKLAAHVLVDHDLVGPGRIRGSSLDDHATQEPAARGRRRDETATLVGRRPDLRWRRRSRTGTPCAPRVAPRPSRASRRRTTGRWRAPPRSARAGPRGSGVPRPTCGARRRLPPRRARTSRRRATRARPTRAIGPAARSVPTSAPRSRGPFGLHGFSQTHSAPARESACIPGRGSAGRCLRSSARGRSGSRGRRRGTRRWPAGD